MAKLFLVCMTAFAISCLKYFAGPIALKGIEIDFMQSMQPRIIHPNFKPDRVKYVPPSTPWPSLPLPDLPTEPATEPSPY